MAIIKKSANHKCWRGCGEKGTLLHGWWEYKLIRLLWRTVWRFLKKLKIELPYGPAIPLLGIYPEKTIIRRVMYCNIHCSSIYNSQNMEASQLSINRWVDKEDIFIAHIYNGILLSHKKKWNWGICNEVDGPRDCHTEWSKSEREKQIPYANAYILNLKKKKVLKNLGAG